MARYPEANYLHKKMLRVSRKFYALSNRKKNPELHTPLLRGQCNCPYWHGVFGGLYLPHLRHGVWKELLDAEFALDNSSHRGRKWVDIERADFDADGFDELLLENAYLNAYISPRRGGSMFEWDFRPKVFNLLNTLTRRPEAYHDKLLAPAQKPEPETPASGEDEYLEGIASIHEIVQSKEPGLEKLLNYDVWPRVALLDYRGNCQAMAAAIRLKRYLKQVSLLSVKKPYKRWVVSPS